MAGGAITGNSQVIKDTANEACGGVAQRAILGSGYVLLVFTECRHAIMAGTAIVHDTGMVEHGANKGSGVVANTTILVGLHMTG